jgi:hypothetical protein
MGFRNPLQVRNGTDAPMAVVVEPWATEFVLEPGGVCEVVATHPDQFPTFGVEPTAGKVIVWVNEGGSLYEIWQGGVQVD